MQWITSDEDGPILVGLENSDPAWTSSCVGTGVKKGSRVSSVFDLTSVAPVYAGKGIFPSSVGTGWWL